MSLLTDDDKLGIAETVVHLDFTESFTDCIDRVCELAEAATIAKLAGVSVEPVGYEVHRAMSEPYLSSLKVKDALCNKPLYTATQLAAARVQENERIAAEFDRRAKPATGFYEPHEPAEIVRALIGGKE